MKIFCITIITIIILFPIKSFAHKEWVHQHIVYEAYRLLSLYYNMPVSEIENNLGSYGAGTGPWIHGEILKGAYREDLEDPVTNAGGIGSGWSASSTHFWLVDENDFGNCPITTIWIYPAINAYHKAYKYLHGGWRLRYISDIYEYNSLVDLYVNGNIHWVGYINEIGEEFPRDEWLIATPELRRILVWEILGRVCHLLADMSVPAHVHLDPHPCDIGDEDNYEVDIAGAGNGVLNCNEQTVYPGPYTNYTAETAFNSGNFIDPFTFDANNPIRYLFYSTAQIADHFASQDWAGDNDLGNNPYPGMQDYINSLGQAHPQGQVNVTENANVLMNLVIKSTASLLYWFAREADLMKSVTISSNQLNQFVQVRNPARSISQTSNYEWKATPNTLEFDNSITLDLMADPWANGYDFDAWEKRDRNNVAIDYNSQLEWLNANATATSTFIANYLPLVTVSLDPIQIESSNVNAHYKNLTTGEISSSFTFPQGFPVTIEAIAPQDYLFLEWSDGFIENPRSFNPTSNISGVYATFKKIGASNNTNAYSNNSQRKFASNYFGILLSVYDSMDKVWVEYSTDNGQSWHIGNEGKPLFEGTQAKNPSLEFYNPSSTSSRIYVTAQLNNNNQSEIAVSVLSWQPSTLHEMAVWQLPSVIEEYDYLTNNFQPVIGFLTTDFLMIAYPIDYGTSGSVLWVEVGELLYNYSIDWNYQYNFISSTYTILTPTLYSTKPSLDPAQSEIYSCWLAYEEKTSTSYSQIMVAKLDLDFSNPIAGDFQVQYSEENNISYGSGYSKNYSPNIDCQIFENIGGKSDVVRLSWIGKRVTYEEEEELELGKAPPPSERRVLHKYKMFSNWSALYVYGDDVMGMSQNHGDNIIGNWQPYTLAWSEVNLGIVTNKYLRSHDTYPTPIRTLNTSGEQIQVNNGSDFDDMYVNSFQNSTLPYSFELSESLSGGLSKENSFAIKQGREGVVVKDEAGFYFAIGDIVLDGENINFVDFDDSLSIENQEILNEYLQSSSFAVSDNSSLTYGVQYGIVDSLLAVSALSDSSAINFKVQLIDNQTGEVIGLFDNISYSQDNVFQYNNIGYQVDMTGIGNRTVQFKLLVETEAECDFFLSKRFADEVILGKAGYTQVKYQGSLAVTNYTIEQNYPNPFNPSTTIKYQIPQNGFVTIKVYDILGKEIATLVNEEKTSGRYEVNFNASSFASGVYLYRLNVNDYVDVKKMILLK